MSHDRRAPEGFGLMRADVVRHPSVNALAAKLILPTGRQSGRAHLREALPLYGPIGDHLAIMNTS
jgi:hypothetical protein